MVDGKIHHFGARGLYNGLFLLGDQESGSFWDHITGECVYGPLKGHRLDVFPLLHTNVARALASHPDVRIAISKQSLIQKFMSFVMERGRRSRKGLLPPGFKRTMGEEDTRRPRMDIGLCVWTGAAHRYYPLERLHEVNGALIDEFEGRRLLVYIDPVSKIPTASYTDATGWSWQGGELLLDTGEVIREGTLFGSQGQETAIRSPLQLFSRWYGCAYTFPGCEIYGD